MESRRLQHRLLLSWRMEVADRARLRHALCQGMQRRAGRLLHMAMLGWSVVVMRRRRDRHLLTKGLGRCASSLETGRR